jgi:hypothetical protein
MTAPTFKPPSPVSFDDLDDTSVVSTGKSARELDRAHVDTAAGISMGTRRSTERVVNQVAQFDCEQCRGSGTWYPSNPNSSHPGGPCRKCKGTGKLKTDYATRMARKRGREQAVEERKAAYILAHEAEFQWCAARMGHFDFARAMMTALGQYHEWTPNQLAAIRKCIAADEARAKEWAAAPPTAQVAGGGFDRMLKAFAAANASGLKNPKFRVGDYAFKPAKPGSKNPGCVYVTRGDTYLGRITAQGAYFESRDSSPADRARIELICKDPFAAAVLHGQQTGRCSCCGAELTNPESIKLGIGPICRSKWGL